MSFYKLENRVIWPTLIAATLGLIVWKSGNDWHWCLLVFALSFVLYSKTNYTHALLNMEKYGEVLTYRDEGGLELFKLIVTILLLFLGFLSKFILANVIFGIVIGIFFSDIFFVSLSGIIEKRFRKNLYSFIKKIDQNDLELLLLIYPIFAKERTLKMVRFASLLLCHRDPKLEIERVDPDSQKTLICILLSMRQYVKQLSSIRNEANEARKKQKIKSFKAKWNSLPPL